VTAFFDALAARVQHCVNESRGTIVKRTIILLSLVLALFACKKNNEVATPVAATQPTPVTATVTAPTATLPPGHPAIPAAAAPATGGKVTGTIAETFDAGGYTYLKLKTATGDEWAAIRQTPVKKGETVTMDVQMTAEKFESKTLKRTFDRILFGALSGSAATTPPPPQASAAQHMATVADTSPIKVAKAEGSGGKTVAEVWSSKDSLKDGHVVVRGKVVKFLGGIMGKNWIHLRDGSGSAEKGDNDLAVTTNDVAAVGDVVVISGVVHVDKDFGAGYRYPVIIEEAKVTK
jgi:hypothetical protein